MKVGVLGAGQLALMMAEVAPKLNIELVAYDPSPTACAKQLIPVTTGEYCDAGSFIVDCDIVTIETETIPVDCAKIAGERLSPPLDALRVTQDRLLEKTFLRDNGVMTADFADIHSVDDLKKQPLPGILKTRRDGYDGKGQFVVRSQDDSQKAWQCLNGKSLLFESFVNFDCEVSLISVRSKNGEFAFYPLVLNQHVDGILNISKAPYDNNLLQQKAEKYAKALMEKWQYIGVLTIEFFVVGDELIANEMAPRVHNSGHWTIEGAETSQFENHLRAITGMPLGSTKVTGKSVMTNIIGEPPEVMTIPNAHYHLYGKESRPKRKLGHVTVVSG